MPRDASLANNSCMVTVKIFSNRFLYARSIKKTFPHVFKNFWPKFLQWAHICPRVRLASPGASWGPPWNPANITAAYGTERYKEVSSIYAERRGTLILPMCIFFQSAGQWSMLMGKYPKNCLRINWSPQSQWSDTFTYFLTKIAGTESCINKRSA